MARAATSAQFKFNQEAKTQHRVEDRTACRSSTIKGSSYFKARAITKSPQGQDEDDCCAGTT